MFENEYRPYIYNIDEHDKNSEMKMLNMIVMLRISNKHEHDEKDEPDENQIHINIKMLRMMKCWWTYEEQY